MIVFAAFVAPSTDGNASTSESEPRCQVFGAVAPAIPGVARSFAATAFGSPWPTRRAQRVGPRRAIAGREGLACAGGRAGAYRRGGRPADHGAPRAVARRLLRPSGPAAPSRPA